MSYVRVSLIVLACALVSACGSGVGNEGALVGGACENDADCHTRCEQGGDFPGGLCTRQCSSNNDCPGGTVCADVQGGVCLMECMSDAECRGGWHCDDVELEGSPNKALACTDD